MTEHLFLESHHFAFIDLFYMKSEITEICRIDLNVIKKNN